MGTSKRHKWKQSGESSEILNEFQKMGSDTSIQAAEITSNSEEHTLEGDLVSQPLLKDNLDHTFEAERNDAELSKAHSSLEKEKPSHQKKKRKKKSICPLSDNNVEQGRLELQGSETTAHFPEMNNIPKKKKKKRNDPENYDLEGKQLSTGDFSFDVTIDTQQERTKSLLETSQIDSVGMEPARLELLVESKKSSEKKRKKMRTNKKQNYPESLDFKENQMLTGNFGSDVAVGQPSTEKPILETSPMGSMNAEPVPLDLSTSEATAHSDEIRKSPEKKRKKLRTKEKRNNVESHDLEGNQLSIGNSGSDITVVAQEAEKSILKTSQLESMEVEPVRLDLFAPEATFHCEETIKAPEKNSRKSRKKKKLNDATLLETEKSCVKTSQIESMIVEHVSPDLPAFEATSNYEEISTEPEKNVKKPRKKRKSMLKTLLAGTLSMDSARLDLLASEETSHSEKLRKSPDKKSKRPRKNKKLDENYDPEENHLLTCSFGSDAPDRTQLETDLDHHASEAATRSSDLGVIPEWRRKKPRKNKKPNKPKNSDVEGKQPLNGSLVASDVADVKKLKTSLVNVESPQTKLDRSTKKPQVPMDNLILALPCNFTKSDKDKAMKKNDILTGIESSSGIFSVSNQNNQELPPESSVGYKKSKTKNCAVSEIIKAPGPTNKENREVSNKLASKPAAIYELGTMSKICQEGCTMSLPNSENTGELELLTEFRKTKTISQEGNTSINSVLIENADLHRVSGEIPRKVASKHKVEFGIPSPLTKIVSVDIVKEDNHKTGTKTKKRSSGKKKVGPFVDGENLQLFMDGVKMEKLTPLNEDEKNGIMIGTTEGEGIRTKERKKRRKKLVSSVCEENFQVSTNTVNLEKMSAAKDDDENAAVASTLDKKDNTLATCAQPISTTKRILLILDLNGLLADIVESVPDGYKADIKIAKKFLFKRPFFDAFLKFCFERFNVAVWSSRIRRNVDSVVDYLMGDMKKMLLFCWDQSFCTVTRHFTLDNSVKPLVFKELKKVWDPDRHSLPWVKGAYNESNTLLLDDSPYKALRNPSNTAIFPRTYSFLDANDNSLGPDGDLYKYLEGLATAEDVQKYVKQHPFGQDAITSTHPCWNFYGHVVRSC